MDDHFDRNMARFWLGGKEFSRSEAHTELMRCGFNDDDAHGYLNALWDEGMADLVNIQNLGK
jgi:hypothetical protein